MKDFSNYHKINTGEKIQRDALLLLQKSLDGYGGYDVVINDDKVARVLLSQRYDSDGESMKVIGHIQDIERGDLINCNGIHWLVTTMPEENKAYRKAVVQVCNSTFPIETDKTSLLMTDDDGNPVLNKFGDEVFIDVDGSIEHEPCVVETTYFNKDNNVQLPLPQGTMKIKLKYQKASNIKINYEFKMYDETYKIEHVDYSKVINGYGIMIINAKKDGG